MILPLAVIYDNNGDPACIRYLQFTMQQDVAADFTWEYYNSLVTTPWSTLEILDKRVLDIPFKEACAKAALLSLLTGKHYGNNYHLGNVSGVTRIRADSSLVEDYLQVIAIKRASNRQGTNSVAVVSREKLLTGIVEVLVVDYKGNIRRVNWNWLWQLNREKKIKLGNVDYRENLCIWGTVPLVRKIDCASEEIRNTHSDMINVAELNSQVAKDYGSSDPRDRMSMVLAETDVAIIPEGWLGITSNQYNNKVKTVVCPSVMRSVTLKEDALQQLKAPDACSTFKLEGSSTLRELELPRVVAASIKNVVGSATRCVEDSSEAHFSLIASHIPQTMIDQSGYYDLAESCITINGSAPNLQRIIMAQPRISGSLASDFGLDLRSHYWHSDLHTRLHIENAPVLQTIVFRPPQYSIDRYHATNDTGQEIVLINTPALKHIQIQGKSLKCFMRLEGTDLNFTLEAHSIRALQIACPPSRDIVINFRIKYLHDMVISIEGHKYSPLNAHKSGSSFIGKVHIRNGKLIWN